MQQALFLNGVYEGVLEEILESQISMLGSTFYLQPYTSSKIKLLADTRPSKSKPIKLYLSTTTNLNQICFIAEVVGWEDKREIKADRLELLNKHIKTHQQGENEIYMTIKRTECVNLISIINLQRLESPFSRKNLIKISDNKPLKDRSRAGGWSYVYTLPDWIGIKETLLKERFDQELEKRVKASKELDNEAKRYRLENAPKEPEQVQVISLAYKRNYDVIAEVLIRANGKCEHCKSDAPFLRAKDDTPYLEIHHWIPLSEGGEDTVANAGAVCPNCHRELHFGKTKGKLKYGEKAIRVNAQEQSFNIK